jgi:cellulose synthase/poly-beta-1,6-N-acetylglucosamine synthase-like glycosyltransferase
MAIFFIIASVLSLYYLWVIIFLYSGLKRLEKAPISNTSNTLSFSIIIAARNEASNIIPCLSRVLSQSIEKARYEVILVNDRSTDTTAQLANDLARSHANLSVTTITETPRGWSPKKYAVSQGIAKARNDVIVFTDADCRVPAAWLETIALQFDRGVGLVQGITTYSRIEGMHALFFGIQAIDFLSHGVIAAAAIGAGFPINSNANNMAFLKKAFTDCGGYGEAGSVVSGDDDLLLQRIYKSKTWAVRYMAGLRGAVETFPAPTVSAVFEQRKRWGSKTVHYNMRQAFFLGGIFCFYCLLLVSLLGAFLFPHLWRVAVILLIIKLFGEAALLIPGTRIFNKKELRPFIAPASLLHLPMVIVAVIAGVFGKFKWKGQSYSRTIQTNPPKGG